MLNATDFKVTLNQVKIKLLLDSSGIFRLDMSYCQDYDMSDHFIFASHITPAFLLYLIFLLFYNTISFTKLFTCINHFCICSFKLDHFFQNQSNKLQQ